MFAHKSYMRTQDLVWAYLNIIGMLRGPLRLDLDDHHGEHAVTRAGLSKTCTTPTFSVVFLPRSNINVLESHLLRGALRYLDDHHDEHAVFDDFYDAGRLVWICFCVSIFRVYILVNLSVILICPGCFL
jgi:hypothetical protein